MLTVNSDYCTSFEMYIGWFLIVEGQVRPLVVVEPDGLADSGVSMIEIDKEVCEAIFVFQDTVDTFCQGIIIAVTDFAHAGLDTERLEAVAVGVGRVLDTVVRVMDEALECVVGGLANGTFQGSLASFDSQGSRQVIADNEA